MSADVEEQKHERAMRHSWSRFVLGALVLIPAVMLGAPKLVTKRCKVGRNLQTFASVKLSEQAPDGGLEVTLKSDDPNRLLFAAAPDKPGTPSITLKINAHFVQTPDFCVYGLADKGIATYTASVAGFERVKRRITLARSAILISDPLSRPRLKRHPRCRQRSRCVRSFWIKLENSCPYNRSREV